MKVSYHWLKELVDFDLGPDVLADRLTMVGLEVDAVFYQKEVYEKIVVGQIVSIKKHPKADNLSLCLVDTGREKLSVVCGAKNIAEGIKVPVAPLETRLPSGIVIDQRDIRGVSSEGMICSAMELALEDVSEGIMVLPENASPGEDIATALELDDVVIDIDLTPNRSDCLSMIGIAREIASILNKKINLPSLSLTEQAESIEKLTSVDIEDPDLCPRYAARVIKDVTIKPSPLWMQKRLRALGLRPINNIVDITNYVLMEQGHPLHAFDYDLLQENRIVVRKAKNREEIVTLDDVERKLDREMLIIADSKRPVAIAGVMGGLNTLVTEKTRNVLLESAYFDPISIRRTAKRLKLHTEASHRFERGADPEGVIRASERAASLLHEIGKGRIAAGVIDAYPKEIENPQIALRTERVNSVLGTVLKSEQVADYLQRLGIKVSGREGALTAQVPSFRRDLSREIDLIEEVARLHGYDNIKTTLPQPRLVFRERDPFQDAEKLAKEILKNCGFYEVINYSFINESDLDSLGLSDGDRAKKFLQLRNPISQEAGIMRTTLLPGLLRNLALNNHRNIHDVKLFEVGRVFLAKKRETELPEEKRYVSGIISGAREGNFWYSDKKECDFFDIKGTVEALFSGMNVTESTVYPADISYLYPTRSMTVEIKGEKAGVFGQIKPDVLEAFDIQENAFGFEIEMEKLLSSAKKEKEFIPLPKHPSVLRDIAVVVDAGISSADLIRIIKETDRSILQDVSLFDVYQGKPIPEGKKSLACSLTFRAHDRTLTDVEVDVIYEKIVQRLQESLDASLR